VLWPGAWTTRGIRDVHFCDEVSPNVQFLLESYSDTQDVIQFFDTLEEYADAVDGMSEQELITELSYEAAKLAEIASVKLEHLDKATNRCKWAVLLWVALLVTVACLEIVLPQIP
jgi:hypothetical protein